MNFKNLKKLRHVLVALTLTATPFAPAFSQVTNGSFETVTPVPLAGSFTALPAGDPGLPGWTILASIDVHDKAHFNIGVPLGGGQRHIDLNPAGGVSQTVTVSAGGIYDFSFWRSIHRGTTACTGNTILASAVVDVTYNNGSTTTVLSTSTYDLTAADTPWVHVTTSLNVPGSGTLTLRFRGTTACSGNSFGGMTVDLVSLTSHQLPPPTNCSDSCFWKVTGNTINSSNNVLGTLTSSDIRIFTASQPVGIINAQGMFGFGNMTPGNRVEITHGTQGNSGLRFTNLTNASSAGTSSGKVLSVNATGDVVLETAAGGGTSNANNGVSFSSGFMQLGQDCQNGSGSDLLSNRAIPMNDHNLIFRDGKLTTPFTDRIGIGTSGCVPAAKLEVIRNQESTVYEASPKAVSLANHDLAATGAAIGLYALVDNPKNQLNMGADIEVHNGTKTTYGVVAFASATKGVEAYGGIFSADGAQRNIGVYGIAANSSNGGAGPSYAGYFDGDVYSSTGVYASSDRNIKKNIQPITNALDLIAKIQPHQYEFDRTKYPALNLPDAKVNYGVIAQEIEEILPGLVKETPVPNGDKGFLDETIKAVNYTQLIPILIQAVKEQQKEIEDLKAAATHQTTGITEQTTTANGGYLAQNAPNPFSVETVISYQLPKGTQKAAIGVYDMNGRELKLFQLSTEQNGSITIKGNDLIPGMYLYSLIVDGKSFDSKRMILTSN